MRWLTIMVGILLISMVTAQVPPDVDLSLQESIKTEHKATRKFVSDELTRQRNEFFKAFDDQAEYYEDRANDIINKAVTRLTLLWAGVVFLVFGVSNFLNRKLEKRKWNKMLESAKEELKKDVDKQQEALAQKEAGLKDKEALINHKINQYNQARPQLMEMQQRLKQQEAEIKQLLSGIDTVGRDG